MISTSTPTSNPQLSPITVDKYLRGEAESPVGAIEDADPDVELEDQFEEVYDEATGEVVLVKVDPSSVSGVGGSGLKGADGSYVGAHRKGDVHRKDKARKKKTSKKGHGGGAKPSRWADPNEEKEYTNPFSEFHEHLKLEEEKRKLDFALISLLELKSQA
jgi:hypothetical protein